MRRLARGELARLPLRYLYVLVAAAHGTSAEDVRAWPADDFLDAANMLPLTGGRHGQ